MDWNNALDTSNKASTFIISAVGLIVLIIGWIKGWWKTFRKFGRVADKTNMFIDNILPDLLGHACGNGYAPKEALQKWTSLISNNAVSGNSPLTITEYGKNLVKEIGLDRITENDKECWATELKASIITPATKYDIEAACISFVIKKFTSDDPLFDSVKNYIFNNPGKIDSTTIYALSGLMLRDYIFEKHPDWVKLS